MLDLSQLVAQRRADLQHSQPTGADSIDVERLRHDLRQPLSTVMLLVAAIETDPTLPSQVRGRLNLIQNETEWIAEILTSTEDSAATVQVVELGEAVESVCSAVAAAATCQLRFTNENANVLVDPVLLRRSARNLLDNAVRAVGVGGTVDVRVLRSATEAVLEVADNGPGFARLAPQQGLGLQTVRKFVDRFGGSLGVGRASMGGALVTLRLPLAVSDRYLACGDPA